MHGAPHTQALLERVARRKQWGHFGHHLAVTTSTGLALCLVAILIARLTALFPGHVVVWLLAAFPLIGAVVAWWTHPRVSHVDAARLIDRAQRTHDLFLTAVHLQSSAGAYQDRIRQRAEQAAEAGCSVKDLLPWRWGRPAGRLLGLLLVILATLQWLPQWDPFSKHQQRTWLAQQEQRLKELREEGPSEAQSELAPLSTKETVAVQKALSDLKRLLDPASTTPSQEETARRLQESQGNLGRFWRQLNDEALTQSLKQARQEIQQFGRSPHALSPEGKSLRDAWRKMLREGKSGALEAELADLLEKIEAEQKANDTPSPSEAGISNLADRLQSLANAISKDSPSEQALRNTLERALEQLQLAQTPSLKDDALNGAENTLNELQRQLESLGDRLEQLKQIEQALDAAQLAQRLNELGKLPGNPNGEGAAQGQSKSLQDYAELYRELLAQQGTSGGGRGEGMKGPGTGEGGEAPEDDSLKTDFKDGTSPSHLVAGRTLLEWRTRGVSETGHAEEAYEQSMHQLKQSLNEAIRQEQIPSGYHPQIKTYFDALAPSPAPAAALD